MPPAKLSLLITAPAPRAGKTMVGCALAFALKVRGFRVGVMKPVALGCAIRAGALVADDAAALLASASSALALDAAAPYRYCASAPPLEAARADGAPPPDFAAISSALDEIQRAHDAVIVEDAWRLDAQIDSAHDFADLARRHRLALVIVMPADPDSFARAAAVIDFARRRGLEIRGAIVNALDSSASAALPAAADSFAAANAVPMLGVVRHKEPLALAIVERLLQPQAH